MLPRRKKKKMDIVNQNHTNRSESYKEQKNILAKYLKINSISKSFRSESNEKETKM